MSNDSVVEQIRSEVPQKINHSLSEEDDPENVKKFYFLSSLACSGQMDLDCSLCTSQITPRKSTVLVKHVLRHLPTNVLAYQCNLCLRYLSENVHYTHAKTVHAGVDKNTISGRRIRPDIADDATDLLLKCFPKYAHLRMMSSKEIESLLPDAVRRRMRKNRDSLVGRKDKASQSDRTPEADEKWSRHYENYCSEYQAEFVRRHADGVLNSCGKCDRIFNKSTTRSREAIRHFESHLSEMPYICPICNATVSYVTAHLRRKHRGEETEVQPQDLLIRPELAAEAIENLKQCVRPQFTFGRVSETKGSQPSVTKVEIEEVTEKNRQNLEDLAELYPLVLEVLAQKLKIDCIRGKKPACSLCRHLIKDPEYLARKTQFHVLSHISEKLYVCSHCSAYYNRWSQHRSQAEHESSIVEGNPVIRLEVIRFAFDFTFRCYPDFTDLLEKTPSELRSLLKFLRSNARLNTIYGTAKDWTTEVPDNLNESEGTNSLGKEYIAISSSIIREANRAIFTLGEPIACEKCDLEFRPSNRGGNVSTMRNHVLTHLSAPPYLCVECGQLVCRILRHVKKEHGDTATADTVSINYPIRPEIAEEAMLNLFQCFPDFLFTKTTVSNKVKTEALKVESLKME